MTDHLLRLAGAALALLAAQILPVEAQEQPSMALVLIGPKDDNSWAEAAYRALEAEAGRGSRTAFAESVADADVARVMRFPQAARDSNQFRRAERHRELQYRRA